MLEEMKVVEVNSDKIVLERASETECTSCSAAAMCTYKKTERIKVSNNNEKIKVGDTVLVEIPLKKMKSSFLAYLIPIVIFVSAIA